MPSWISWTLQRGGGTARSSASGTVFPGTRRAFRKASGCASSSSSADVTATGGPRSPENSAGQTGRTGWMSSSLRLPTGSGTIGSRRPGPAPPSSGRLRSSRPVTPSPRTACSTMATRRVARRATSSRPGARNAAGAGRATHAASSMYPRGGCGTRRGSSPAAMPTSPATYSAGISSPGRRRWGTRLSGVRTRTIRMTSRPDPSASPRRFWPTVMWRTAGTLGWTVA